MATAILILAGFVLAILVGLALNDRRPGATVSGLGDAPLLEGNGLYSTEVVGESHYQDALDQICGGKCEDGHELEVVAHLIPEPDNPYDKNAVGVHIQGRKVGHLPRDMAAAMTAASARKGYPGQSFTCDAMITGGWRRERRGEVSEGHYGVILDLGLDDEDEFE